MISNSWVIVIGVGVGAGGGTGVGATAHAAPARDAIITNETIRRCIKAPVQSRRVGAGSSKPGRGCRRSYARTI